MVAAATTEEYFYFIESILIIAVIAFGVYDCRYHDFEERFSSFLEI